MTGGPSNGGSAIVLWAAEILFGFILLIGGAHFVLDRWRAYLPQAARVTLGYLCCGDPVRCPLCECEAVAEAVPDWSDREGYSLICSECREPLRTEAFA